ncbi:hypothetical protein [Ekhidna sp.]|uniref:hypothetical protein n=1 Tax=Ekhidna sp. TaxID=2608089 RepID=UPI003B5104F3
MNRGDAFVYRFDNDDQKQSLLKHVKMVYEKAQSSNMKAFDLEDLKKRYDEIDCQEE